MMKYKPLIIWGGGNNYQSLPSIWINISSVLNNDWSYYPPIIV